ncbi:MAG: hypothetical protein DDT19_00954 [Syntrophomonadaceae bacterium]|nr:hypothetical protein [Bacillota bacterium]
MENITSFENIDELTIKKLASEYNAIDGDKFTMELIRSPFPFGYSEIPDEIELMKIVHLKSEKDLDKEKLSVHYFANPEDIENIKSQLNGADHEGTLYLITVKTNKQNIDVEQTLRNNLLYQFEYETTLKPNSDVSIIKVERLK